MSSATTIITREYGFHIPPGYDKSIFAVNAGVPAAAAIIAARCLTDSLRAMARQGVHDEIDSHAAHAMAMLAEMVDGILGSLEGSI